MNNVHLIYPHGDRISAPDSIGRHLAEGLRERYRVHLHDWDELRPIEPEAGGILIGHPHPGPGTIFKLSAKQPGWSRRIILCPFNPEPRLSAHVGAVIRRCDTFCAIVANYWFDRIPQSVFRGWAGRMRQMDMAVDPSEFPFIKPGFNPPGKRRFLYIGWSGSGKNTAYLSAVARAMPDAEFGWIGHGREPISGVQPLGYKDFRDPDARALVARYDFMITVSHADANPTTILEAMAWGLIPVCTPQSGYEGEAGIPNVPLNDVAAAARILDGLNKAPEAELLSLQQMNRQWLTEKHTWATFTRKIVSAIEDPNPPPAIDSTPREETILFWNRLCGHWRFKRQVLSSRWRKMLEK